MKFITIYTTHSSLLEAKECINPLLKRCLIACVNYFPIESAYHWNGEIETAKEVVALLKTRLENWEIVREEIKKTHPYETPCIIKTVVEGNDEYVQWVNKETNT